MVWVGVIVPIRELLRDKLLRVVVSGVQHIEGVGYHIVYANSCYRWSFGNT